MTATSDHTPLELLVRQAGGRDANPIVLLPQAPGSGADAIARALVQNLDEAHWRLLPAPGEGADVLRQRGWHRDAWLAMSAADRDSVALVTGATAGYLAPVLADAARTVVFVRDPLAGAARTGERVPKLRGLERLAETPAAEIPERLRRIANPQSRALLAPWHDPAELPVTPGPPTDADRWRDALFGDVLPHLDASALEQAPSVARELLESLGGRSKSVMQAANAAAHGKLLAPDDPARVDLLLRFNWLDAELYERFACPSGQAG